MPKHRRVSRRTEVVLLVRTPVRTIVPAVVDANATTKTDERLSAHSSLCHELVPNASEISLIFDRGLLDARQREQDARDLLEHDVVAALAVHGEFLPAGAELPDRRRIARLQDLEAEGNLEVLALAGRRIKPAARFAAGVLLRVAGGELDDVIAVGQIGGAARAEIDVLVVRRQGRESVARDAGDRRRVRRSGSRHGRTYGLRNLVLSIKR